MRLVLVCSLVTSLFEVVLDEDLTRVRRLNFTMYAVGRLGSYISRGVCTVSSPFHPFSGAVDIVVVEQQDGSFKSSPWYVQFGKFQGVLKAREKVVHINVNGVDADFHMYLDNRGEAYFVREVDEEEEGTCFSFSGDDIDGKSMSKRMPEKTMSCIYDTGRARVGSDIYSPKGKSMSQSKSAGPKIFGLVIRPGSAKKNGLSQQEGTFSVQREGSLERAEIAAKLLEVRWSTNLASSKTNKGNNLRVSDLKMQDGGLSQKIYCVKDGSGSITNCSHEDSGSSLSTSPSNYMEAFRLEEAYLELNLVSGSFRSSSQTDSIGSNQAKERQDSDNRTVESVDLNSVELQTSGSGISIGDGKDKIHEVSEGASESRPKQVHSSIYCGTSGSSKEAESNACSALKEVDRFAQAFCDSGKPECHKESELPSKIVGTGCKIDKIVESGEHKNLCEPLTNANDSQIENCLVSSVASVIDSINVEAGPVTEVHIAAETEDSYQELRLTKRSAAQGQIYPSFGSQEAVYPYAPSSSNSHHSELCVNNGFNKDYFQDKAAAAGSPEISEEQFLMDDIHDSDIQKSGLVERSDSTRKELNIVDIIESSEDRVNGSSDIIGSTDFATDYVEQDVPKHLELTRTLSSPISIARVQNDVDVEALTAESLPSLWSNSTTMDVQVINHPLSRSLDSSFVTMALVEDDIPATLETEAEKKQGSASDVSKGSQIPDDLRRILSDPAVELSLCGYLLSEGMGYEAASVAFDSEKLDLEEFASLGPDIVEDERLIVRIGGLYFPWDAALPIVSKIGSSERVVEPKGMIAIDQVEQRVGPEPKSMTGPKKSKWKLWPFSSDVSDRVDKRQSTPVKSGNSPRGMPVKREICSAESSKKKVIRAKTPSSEELASLNLKEGKNTVIFTFSTPVLGEQKVDARIFLWKWNAKIVISDVDGTITKSDVLGQFMPLMGIDWSQTGVTHLFSGIKENGYELLFLSARAISQSNKTRQFLFSLKQDGKALPEGPVVISPDGLFPSLFREVIRRAPHEFKIACLEEIKALFPPGSSPFYAGFGNRDTDELSYLKVGIPRGKIFIINPRGEVAVHRRVDTKSYSSLHVLVHNMFPPPTSVHGTEQEDYNSWNFWKLPPPDIGV